jgi:Na+/melibiose symporter-like transporter
MYRDCCSIVLSSFSPLTIVASLARNIHLFTAFYCMMYCSFVLNVWMYVCLRSHRERSGWGARRTRRRSPWAAVGWWRQVSLDLSLSYTFFNSPPAFHIYCLALCYCSTLINEHDENYQWYVVFPSFIMMLYLWHSRGLERFSSASP